MSKFLREHLQLMELLLCILFFMAGSLMAGSLFIRASQIEQVTQELQSAVSIAQRQAELMRVSDTVDSEVLYYDGQWQLCTEAEHVYQLVIKQHKHVVTIEVTRSVNGEAELIYSLETGGRL